MNEIEDIPVDLAQRLILTVNHYQTHLAKRLKSYDIGLSEYPVLIYLYHRDDGEKPLVKVSQSDIAQRQHRDPALITRAAKGLAKKGLISVVPDPDNRARNVLELTPEGRAIAAKVDGLVVRWEKESQAGLTSEERDQLKDLLARLQLPS